MSGYCTNCGINEITSTHFHYNLKPSSPLFANYNGDMANALLSAGYKVLKNGGNYVACLITQEALYTLLQGKEPHFIFKGAHNSCAYCIDFETDPDEMEHEQTIKWVT